MNAMNAMARGDAGAMTDSAACRPEKVAFGRIFVTERNPVGQDGAAIDDADRGGNRRDGAPSDAPG